MKLFWVRGTAGGLALAPVSGGTSLVVSSVSAGAIVHGGSVATIATARLTESLKGLMGQMHFSRNKSGKGKGNGSGDLNSLYAWMKADDIIAKYRKASVRLVFPEELLDKTWEEIVKGANSGKKTYKTAKKLLTDGRFKK